MIEKEIKILFVENNKYHALLIKKEIENSFNDVAITITGRYKKALELVKLEDFDMGIIDLDSSLYGQLQFIELLKSEINYLPLIVLVSEKKEQLIQIVKQYDIEEIVVKDSSFYLKIPKLIKKIYHQNYKSLLTSDFKNHFQKKEQSEIINIIANTLSHEINNPLMTILGMTEMILDNDFKYDPELIKKVGMIRNSAKRIRSTLKKMSVIKKPAVKETISGKLIDPQKSYILTKTSV